MENLSIAFSGNDTDGPMFEMSNGGTLYLKNVHFDGNRYDTANGDPMWLFNDDAVTVLFEDCTFTDNDAVYRIANGSDVTFTNCSFEGNQQRFAIDAATVTFDGCSFVNHSLSNGSMFTISNDADVVFESTSFIQTTSYGAIIALDDADLSVHNCSFRDNELKRIAVDVVAFWMTITNEATIEFIGTAFLENTNPTIYVADSGTAYFNGTTFIDNLYKLSGSNASMVAIDGDVGSGSGLYFVGTEFTGNRGYEWIIYSNDWASTIVVDGSTFRNNDVVYDLEFTGTGLSCFVPLI